MKKTGKKRQLLAASLLIALAAAVTVNWYYSKSVPETTTDPSGAQTQMLGDTVLVAGTAVNNEEKTTGASVSEADAAAFSKLQMQQKEARDRLEEKIDQVLSTEQLDEATQQQVRDLLDFKIYIQVDPDVCLLRRVKRDLRDRGRTIEGIYRQYLETVKPMYEKHIRNYVEYADLIVARGGKNPRIVDILAHYINSGMIDPK